MEPIPPAPLVQLHTETIDFYINLLENTPIVVLDELGQVDRCNDAFLRMTGARAEQIRHGFAERFFESKSFQHLVRERLSPAHLQQSAMTDHDPASTLQLRLSNGAYLDVSVVTMLAETEQGIRYLLFLREDGMSHRPNLLERLGETTMLGDDETGVILLHDDFSIKNISGLASRLLGVEGRSVLGEPVEKCFGHAPKEYALIRGAFEDGLTVRSHPFTWIRDEQRKEFLMDVGLLRNAKGQAEGAYIIFKDVTNLRSLERQVQRSDRLSMIGQIAAGAAHEIRNPLTAIRGFLQMFRKTMDDKGMVKEVGYTEIMLVELDRINNLVGEFLLLSKPKMVLYDNVDVAEVIRELLPMISSEALLHNATVNWELADELKLVLADREMLKQVLLNICKNGIEAMTNGGTLTIKCYAGHEVMDKHVIIEILDTGPGIPDHMLEKIFDPFVTTKPNGTGLGLSVCQRIIHEFGGTIGAFSRNPGASFVIALPCLN